MAINSFLLKTSGVTKTLHQREKKLRCYIWTLSLFLRTKYVAYSLKVPV